ncbi:uncharacterized protein LOC132903671 [Amyelois transitella]|uniref:uncharacterized protein LOC132903671 n=1 Tax=Amyelois transitella TaxID=680683 RepID=UPI0029907391|nr:uncharacterized protein LOC132903671 [Amyelois transitella]
MTSRRKVSHIHSYGDSHTTILVFYAFATSLAIPAVLVGCASRRARFDKMAAEQETNINFVQEIEKHACLYNYNLPDYMRKNTIDKTWAEIGNKFQITAIIPKATLNQSRNSNHLFRLLVQALNQSRNSNHLFRLLVQALNQSRNSNYHHHGPQKTEEAGRN